MRWGFGRGGDWSSGAGGCVRMCWREALCPLSVSQGCPPPAQRSDLVHHPLTCVLVPARGIWWECVSRVLRAGLCVLAVEKT